MKLTINKLFFAICSILIILVGIFFLTNHPRSYKVIKKMNTPIIGFDLMKLSRDKVENQPSKVLIDNILALVKANFPGTTHIAINTPEDSNADFIAHGSPPGPLPVEQFIDMQLDSIHAAGYNAVLRDFPSSIQNAYKFPVVQKTSDEWVAYNKAFLETHASHLKNGDIIALWYELDWWQRDFGVSINDTGNNIADTNNFIVKNAAMVNAFAKEHNLDLRVRTTYSDVSVGYIPEAVAQAQGNSLVVDHAGNISTPGLSDAAIIANFNTYFNAQYNHYSGKYQVYLQEFGDGRHSADGSDGGIQTTDPGFTGQMADQVLFPLMKSGVMEGVDFWNLFDTPKEGIIETYDANGTRDPDGTNAVTAKLNAKGQALSQVFKKWFGTVTPPTPPSGGIVPPFHVTKNTKVTYDGNGNFTISIS